MKKLRFRRITITALVLCVACSMLFLTACVSTLDSVKSMLKRKYDIKLPPDKKLIYCHYESKDSFHGDGIDYFVFKFNKEPISIVKNFTSLNLKEGDNHDELKEELRQYFDSIDLVDEIPQEYLPNWDSEMIWNSGEFAAIYYPELMEMTVCIVNI